MLAGDIRVKITELFFSPVVPAYFHKPRPVGSENAVLLSVSGNEPEGDLSSLSVLFLIWYTEKNVMNRTKQKQAAILPHFIMMDFLFDFRDVSGNFASFMHSSSALPMASRISSGLI